MTAAILDTSVLIRLVLDDDSHQSAVAFELVESATSIIVPTPVFCEFAWVLQTVKNKAGTKKFTKKMIAQSIREFIEFDYVAIADDEVEAGLKMLEAGGDFADGVIEYTGRTLVRNTTTTFFSFDKGAVNKLAKNGLSALLLQ
ncbi:MAG: type II toxin-antitoxin system VapC family toxin [Zoogloeaceae bacterium]|jgi:predicted nucleic-acid-binding protein|nr:type II toxin-antitoxin system VapC family toxin [Zoogloeaceae bacterium]